MHARVQHRDERVECFGVRAGPAARDAGDPSRHERPHVLVRQRGADAAGVVHDHLHLVAAQVLARHAAVPPRSEARIEPVDHRVPLERPVDDSTASAHSLHDLRGELEPRSTGDLAHLLGRQPVVREHDRRQLHIAPADPGGLHEAMLERERA
jgi:hypothetical protein